MSQCLRCNKPCAENAKLCDGCRSQSAGHIQYLEDSHPGVPLGDIHISSIIAMSPGQGEVSNNPFEPITGSHPTVHPPIELSPALPEKTIDQSEQTARKMNKAAQFVAVTDQRNRRPLRASHLKPLRDISAEIRRESTPLPVTPRLRENQHVEDLSRRLPDLWPWLHDTDADENESESDNWSDRVDPLLSRRFPDSAESARIEQEDLKRAMAEGMMTISLPRHRPISTSMRLAFIALSLLAIVALVLDGALISVHLTNPHQPPSPTSGPPTLSLSSNIASIGETIQLHISHFSPSSQVVLTRDIQVSVKTDTNTSIAQMSTSGSADVTMLVDQSWEPGFHTIVAEDILTRYTASATLQVVKAGPTRPSHLLIDQQILNMGSDLQGANTIKSLTLRNSGGGSISWSASSNQPWLIFSPAEGTFSTSQTIAIAVERNNLKSADYKGIVTFSTNVGIPEQVQVNMNVGPLPAHAGAVLVVTPPVLSFTALDGDVNPADQVLTINNTGLQPLNWSLSTNAPDLLVNQNSNTPATSNRSQWLMTDLSSGTIIPGATGFIHVMVNSQIMLPGVYTQTLTLNADDNVLNTPQSIEVSLTVQPRCGLTLSTGSLSFTAVSGQSNPSTQSLGLKATPSCTQPLKWHATSSYNWLTVAPASGELMGAVSVASTIGVNVASLTPGTYNGTISFLTDGSTQTVVVVLTVQAPPPPSAPIMAAAPLILNFSTTQGMANPAPQIVTITNNGGSQLNWRTSVSTLASSWLGVAPTGGVIKAGQTGQVGISVNTVGLTPGTYTGQVTLNGTDANNAPASGNPQVITINLLVLPPCTLAQPSLSVLAFSATQGSADPSSKSVVITGTGNCGWPLNWKATPTSTASWLKLTPASGMLQSNGQSASIGFIPSIVGLTPGTYTAQVALTATDGSGLQILGSPQTISVTLTVLQPCTLQVSVTSFTFNATQGQAAPAAQNMTVSESANCALPVSWKVAGDTGSVAWLQLSPTAGTDSGTGSGAINVSVNTTGLVPNTYTGYITVTTTGSGGAVVKGSPQNIPVTLIVSGFTVSGTVIACADVTCATPAALPGATVTLLSGTVTVATLVADSAGNFSFTNVALGTYTISVAGLDSKNVHHVGSKTLTITGNSTANTITVLPG